MNYRRLLNTWLQVLFIVAATISGCQSALQTSDRSKDPELGTPMLKLTVDQAGLYRLTSRDLRNAGMDARHPTHLRLTAGGIQVPIWLEESGDDFEMMFYGVLPESEYAPWNIYWLSLDPLEQVDPLFIETKTMGESLDQGYEVYQSKAIVEEKLAYSPLIPDDPWYWLALHAPTEQFIELELGDVEPVPASLTVNTWSLTQAPTEYDHHLKLLINGILVLDELWDGSGVKQLDAQILPGVLKPGKNSLTLESPGDTGAIADTVFLQQIELIYPRSDPASNDRIALIGDGKTVTLTGFRSSVTVFDVTHASHPVRWIDLEQSDKNVRFFAEEGRHYLAIGKMGFLTPKIEMPVELPEILDLNLGVDYLAVGPAELLEPLEPLMALRKEQGITSALLPLAAIYDHFNSGLPEPDAIHNLVLYATENWQIKPKYLLLIGDASYDPMGYLGETDANQLPIYFTNTQFGGLTGTDLPFVDTDADDTPDLAVGRVPARTPREVQAWVKKTIAYEQDLQTKKSFQALAVADGTEISFSQDAQLFLDYLSGGYQGNLYSPASGAQNATEDILRYFETGYDLIGYFGHGSVNMWGRDRLLTNDHVEALTHKNLPIVLTMTCLNGYFIHPTNLSLAEGLLFTSNGGAVAVLAPTSLTLVWDQMSLGENFYQGLASPGTNRLGDVLLNAQQMMHQNMPGQRDVMLTFLLFGDPALRLRGY